MKFRSARQRFHQMIDALEPRRLLAAIINGTASDDTFIISVGGGNSISLTFNGTPQAIGAPGDGNVEVKGLNGNDTITLLNTGTLQFFLEGGLGDEQYTVGNGRLITDIQRDVFMIDGSGAGNESTVINDVNGSGTSYIIDDSSITIFSISAPMIVLPSSVDAGDGVTLRGSGGSDAVRFNSMPQHTHIDLAGGLDTVELGGSQRIVDPNLPANSIIDGGSTGADTILIDDSNAASPRTSLRFDDNGLVGGPALRNFVSMTVKTHQLTAGAPEPVTFRGFTAPVPQINITGAGGEDLVQFGEPGNPITGQNYWGGVVLDLKTGVNRLEINQAAAAAPSSWTFNNGGLSVGTGPASLSAIGNLTFSLNSTNNADLFTVVDTPDLWNIFVDGRGGNDRLTMGITKDLDDVFDCFSFYFMAGTGTDTIDVSDSDDQVGDSDDYTIGGTVGFPGDLPISDGSIAKGDFTANQSTVLAYHDAEKLVLAIDNDSNRVFYDLGGLTTVEIFGNGGSDSFTNRASGTTLPDSLITSLAQFVTFHGGAGVNDLLLRDEDGGPGVYEITSGQFFYIPSTTTLNTINFDGFSNIQVIGSDDDDEVIVRSKPTAGLNIASGEGDDTFSIGGGDLDTNGFFSSGVTLSAGTGNDHIVFDDHLDFAGGGETETYTFGNLSLAKGSLVLLYSTFENQTLLAADGVISGQLTVTPVINLNAISGFLDSTTINGGLSRGCIITVGVNDLNSISGVVNINNANSLTINDTTNTFGTNVSYEVTSSRVSKTSNNQTINYTNVSLITLNASNQANAIAINGVPLGTTVTVNANGGVDVISLGGGDTNANLLGRAIINGGAGSNGMTINNSLDATAATQSLTATSFTDGLIHNFSSITSLTYNGGPGGTTLAVSGISIPMTINGGSGDDTFDIGGGSLATNLAVNITVNGGAGNDAMNVLGQNDTTTASTFNRYTFDSFNKFRFGPADTGRVITFDNFERASLQSSGGNDNVEVSFTVIPWNVMTNGGNDSVTIAGATPTMTVNTGPEASLPFGFRQGDAITLGGIFGAGSAVIDQNDTVINLGVGGSCMLRLTNGAMLNKAWPTGFFIDFGPNLGGTIDLTNGALLWRDGGGTGILPDFRAMLARGRNNGAWNGTSTSGAIHSSTAAGSPIGDAVGHGLGSEIAATSIGGFSIAPGDTLLRYTLDGDANLDSTVNIADFARLAANFNGTGKVWANADFTYDGSTNIGDFSSLAANFNQSLAAPLPRLPARPFASRLIEDILSFVEARP